jgi:4,5-dihydroxyphthalate decarboxylase
MHGTIVVKDSVLKDNPWVARSLFNAFEKAKQDWLVKLHSGEAATAGDKKYLNLTKIVGKDPLPNGMQANLPTIMKLEETAFKQNLTPRRMAIDEIFVDPEKM